MKKIHPPNFFVVGAGKSGTSSLYYYLDQHPDIFMAHVKEPNFFSAAEIRGQKYHYRKIKLIENLDEYLNLFAKADSEKAIGDVSPSYLFRKSAAGNIFNFNPAAKIIMILRNPVTRAYSDYLMDLGGGHYDNSFEDMVFRRINVPQADIYYQIVERGFYYEQVKRYIDLFGKERVKIFLFENLKVDALQVVKTIFAFLGVDSSVKIDVSLKINPYKSPKGIVKLIYYNQMTRSLTKNLLPNSLKDIIMKYFFITAKPAMDTDTATYLTNIFRKDILHLQELIDQDLEPWL